MSGATKDNRITSFQAFISGGLAGVTSRTLTSPLDVVKILAQVGTEESQYGFLKTFGNVYRREGVLAFWKGNGIACLRLFPYSAVQFSTYTKFKVLLMDERGRLSHVNALLAGSMGGLAATIVTYPFDMIKTRLTTQHYHPSKRKYRDIRDAFRVILREEGFLAYFRGISATVLGRWRMFVCLCLCVCICIHVCVWVSMCHCVCTCMYTVLYAYKCIHVCNGVLIEEVLLYRSAYCGPNGDTPDLP